MRVEGDAEELSADLFPHGLVPQILQLLVDAWTSFRRPPRDEDEPKITNRFVNALENERRRRGAALPNHAARQRRRKTRSRYWERFC